MEEEYLMRILVSCVFLWIAAVPDIRAQRIPARVPAVFAAAAVLADLFVPTCMDRRELWAGALPGAVLWLLSFLLKEELGAGDGICLLVSGLLTGFVPALILTEASMILAAIAGGLCIWTKRKRAGDRIAFIPFLAAAQSLILLVEAAAVL